MKLLSLQIGQPREQTSTLDDGTVDDGTVDDGIDDAPWVSSIWKTPVTTRLHLGWEDLDGNGQADLKNHGGPDKAVCCYAAEHYPTWRSRLGKSGEEFGYGAFGENFTLAGLTEDRVCIGDIYTVGTARVQISQPRMPCWKLGRRWERPDLPLEVKASGQTGYYLRVLEEGEVGVGDALTLIERPLPLWTIARVNAALYEDKNDAELAKELSQLPGLAEAWRRQFRRRAGSLRQKQ